MRLDIRLPIGLLFASLGSLLTLYGLATINDRAMYLCSLDLNINLVWGLVLLGFGILMILAGLFKRAQAGG
jgi:hypothetical protein